LRRGRNPSSRARRDPRLRGSLPRPLRLVPSEC
jgi:hypothetical protein